MVVRTILSRGRATGWQWVDILATFRCPPGLAAVEWSPKEDAAAHVRRPRRQTAADKDGGADQSNIHLQRALTRHRRLLVALGRRANRAEGTVQRRPERRDR